MDRLIAGNNNCAINTNCGVGRKGASLHQSGTTFDLYCSTLNGNIDFSKNVIDYYDYSKYNFTHPIGWDTGHFVYAGPTETCKTRAVMQPYTVTQINRTLCDSIEKSIIPILESNYAPQSLVSISETFKTKNIPYFGRSGTQLMLNVAQNLANAIGEIQTHLVNEGSACIPYIDSGYRSYVTQIQSKIDYPTGAALAGYSSHQIGIAVDLLCAKAIDSNNDGTTDQISVQGRSEIPHTEPIINILNKYNFYSLISNDLPHFIYVSQ